MKRLKITENQLKRLHFNMAKKRKIKVTESQVLRAFSLKENVNDIMTIEEFVTKFKEAIKCATNGDKSKLEELSKEFKLNNKALINKIIELGIGVEFSKDGLDYIKFKKNQLLSNFKTLYKYLIGGGESTIEEDIEYHNDPRFTPDTKFSKPKFSEADPKEYDVEFIGDDVAKITDLYGNVVYFNYGLVDKDRFKEYAEREIVGYEQDPDDGSTVEVLSDDFDITDEVLINFLKYEPDANEYISNTMDEMTTSASSGAYVAPLTKGKLSNNKNVPVGLFVSESNVETPYTNSVEFDDCTKLNNNKVALNGGCRVGAIDNVVKVKPIKESEEDDTLEKYYEYIWIEVGLTKSDADDLKEIIESEYENKEDLYQILKDEFEITKDDLNKILDILK